MTWAIFRNQDFINKSDIRCRIKSIDDETVKLQKDLKDKDDVSQVKHLFLLLQNWDTPFVYEAALLQLDFFSEKQKDKIFELLNESINSLKITSEPPPYKKEHSNFYVLTLLSKTLCDERLADTMAKLSKSDNKYTAEKASDALPWLKSKIKYPIKYIELYRSFESRS